MKEFLRLRVGPSIGAWMIRLICWSLRVRLVDHAGIRQWPADKPILFAFWHNRLFTMPYFYRHYRPQSRVKVMISRSRDGQVISEIIARFGMETSRGSSSKKGAEAFREIVRHVKENNYDAAVTPDGPRGPKYQLQDGILTLSQLTGCSIVPVTVEYARKYEFRSWDRFQVPFPFTRCVLTLGAPIQVPPSCSEEELAEWGRRVTEGLGADQKTIF